MVGVLSFSAQIIYDFSYECRCKNGLIVQSALCIGIGRVVTVAQGDGRSQGIDFKKLKHMIDSLRMTSVYIVCTTNLCWNSRSIGAYSGKKRGVAC